MLCLKVHLHSLTLLWFNYFEVILKTYNFILSTPFKAFVKDKQYKGCAKVVTCDIFTNCRNMNFTLFMKQLWLRAENAIKFVKATILAV